MTERLVRTGLAASLVGFGLAAGLTIGTLTQDTTKTTERIYSVDPPPEEIPEISSF